MMDFNNLPKKLGLYDPEYEKDACGVGYVVSIDGNPSNKVSLAKFLTTCVKTNFKFVIFI